MEITSRNVTGVLLSAAHKIRTMGFKEESRNGPVAVFPTPVLLTYAVPKERVLFSSVRNANPFFHFMEALWMLAGRDDLAFPVRFNSRFKEYSDDGVRLNGAYGFRWRKHFGRDQIELVIDELRRNPESRRVVMTMWSVNDLGMGSKDLPCNTHIYFDCRGGELNMTVCNRSNDLIWGACGANAVHMSMLQEYIAFAIGKPVGVYRQFTNNLHIYTDVFNDDYLERLCMDLMDNDLYASADVRPAPMIRHDFADWNADLRKFMQNPQTDPALFYEPFFKFVVGPMKLAWDCRGTDEASSIACNIVAEDWRVACLEWLERYKQRRQK